MKKKHKAELIAALDDLLELIDAEDPRHEYPPGRPVPGHGEGVRGCLRRIPAGHKGRP